MTTVSNVIKKRTDRVSKEKTELIEGIVKKYNYSPNMNARSLVNSSSNLIGLLYHSVDFSDPFVSELLEGIEERAKELGYFILVYNIESIEDVVAVQQNWKFEGFIVVGVLEKLFDPIQNKIPEDVPVVFVDTHLSEDLKAKVETLSERFFIASADEKSGYDAAKFLLEQGHKQIGFLSFKFNECENGVINERFQGFKRAINEFGHRFNERLVFNEQEFDRVANNKDSFTALVVSADFLAVKLIHYLRQRELYDKEKLSIVGFDDVSYAKYLEPPLTTIRLNQKNKGTKAIELLSEAIQNQPIEKFILLPGELVVRESVKSLN